MRKWILALAIAAICAASGGAAVLAGSGASDLPPTWHIHDGQVTLPQHKGIGFFPRILGLTTATYLQDPARCPNATDKAFLPSTSRQSDLLRAGMCMTSTAVIHLRTVPVGTDGPRGWGSLIVDSERGWVTYYLVTAK